MRIKNNFIVIFITSSSKREANRIIKCLIDKRLAACGSISAGCESIFTWKGKVTNASEFLITLKTRRDLFYLAAREVRALHSYEVPEIIAVPITGGDSAYLSWIDGVVRKRRK